MTDGAIGLVLMVYDSEDTPEAQLSGVGPFILHWGAEFDDINVAAEKIRELGGEVMSPLNTGVVKFRAPDGTIAELVAQRSFPQIRRRRIKPCAISPLGTPGGPWQTAQCAT
jgi:hypothetical protein